MSRSVQRLALIAAVLAVPLFTRAQSLTPAQIQQIRKDADVISAAAADIKKLTAKTLAPAPIPTPAPTPTPSPNTPPTPAPTPMPAPPPRSGVPTGGLVHSENLVYQGSFRMPGILVPGKDRGFDYGGGSPSFVAAHQSLLIFSHPYDWFTAEVGIPPSLGTGNIATLPIGTVVTPFVDLFAGQRLAVADPTASVGGGGQLIHGGKLYLTSFREYGGGQTLSHFVRSTDLAQNAVTGPFRIGPLGANFYSGYMSEVPPEWQATFGPTLTGQCCLSVISRTSYGPSVSAFDLTQTGLQQNAVELVGYGGDHKPLGDWNGPGASIYFNGTTEITGLVFPAGTSSLLFFGRHGLGAYCYGEAAACGDQEGTAKGDHGYPYVYYVWAYDAHDLAAVKAGTKQPYDVLPYAVWPLNLPYAPNHNGHHLGGATYDSATGQIFVSQQFADGDNPVIHVFTLR